MVGFFSGSGDEKDGYSVFSIWDKNLLFVSSKDPIFFEGVGGCVSLVGVLDGVGLGFSPCSVVDSVDGDDERLGAFVSATSFIILLFSSWIDFTSLTGTGGGTSLDGVVVFALGEGEESVGVFSISVKNLLFDLARLSVSGEGGTCFASSGPVCFGLGAGAGDGYVGVFSISVKNLLLVFAADSGSPAGEGVCFVPSEVVCLALGDGECIGVFSISVKNSVLDFVLDCGSFAGDAVGFSSLGVVDFAGDSGEDAGIEGNGTGDLVFDFCPLVEGLLAGEDKGVSS